MHAVRRTKRPGPSEAYCPASPLTLRQSLRGSNPPDHYGKAVRNRKHFLPDRKSAGVPRTAGASHFALEPPPHLVLQTYLPRTVLSAVERKSGERREHL